MSPDQPETGAKTDSGPAGGPAKAQPPHTPNAPWRLPILIGAAIAALALVAYVAINPPGARAPAPSGAAAIGGPFQMVDTQGRPADQSLLLGKWSAVFFGYTYCPDVCPATLTTLGAAQARLAKPNGLQTVFVTIDPARDTPAQLKTYLESPVFPRPIVGLTGTDAQVAAIAKAYKAYYAKGPGEGDAYLMDHASPLYLMDPQGRFVTLIRPDVGPEAMAREIETAMENSR